MNRCLLRVFPLLIALLCCSATPGRAADITLARLTFSSGWDALPAIVGIERGFFAQEGLVVSGLSITSPEAVINSLAAGSTDFAVVPQRVALVMVAAKAPVKIIAQGGWGTELELVARTGIAIKSVADLKGKTVATLRGSESLPALVRLLNQAKLKPTDLKILLMSGDDLVKSLSDKKADAVFETRHFTGPLVQNKSGTVALDAASISKAIGWIDATPLLTRAETATKDPKLVQSFTNGWCKALAYIRQDPEDAGRLLEIFFHRQGVRITPAMANSWVGMTKYDQYGWSAAAIKDAEYNGWGLSVAKVLKVAPKLQGFIDNRFADAAAKALQ
jgi:ABC-type nitrate/sulfonate/bicarbonate transport system substrate-binding protein